MSESNNPSPSQHMRVDVDLLAARIVTAACELDGPADPAGDDTISITIKDLEAVVHRHVTVTIERSALAAEGHYRAWEPIESAPRDGTVILLCGGAYHGYPFSGKWDLGPFGDTDRPWLNVINDSRLYGHVPKKWMRLPECETPAPSTSSTSPSTPDMEEVSHV